MLNKNLSKCRVSEYTETGFVLFFSVHDVASRLKSRTSRQLLQLCTIIPATW